MPNESSELKREECERAYRALHDGARSTRTRNNLERLKRALDAMVAMKQSVFTVAAVLRAMRPLGITSPAESSMRNNEGQVYRDLIAVYAACHGEDRTAVALTPDEDLTLSIRDQAVAARVKAVMDRNRYLQAEVNALKHSFTKLQQLDPYAMLEQSRGPGGPGPNAPALLSPPALLPNEVATVRRFLMNASSLLDCEWDAATGALLTPSGMEVTGAGFRQALERLIEQDRSASTAGAPASR